MNKNRNKGNYKNNGQISRYLGLWLTKIRAKLKNLFSQEANIKVVLWNSLTKVIKKTLDIKFWMRKFGINTPPFRRESFVYSNERGTSNLKRNVCKEIWVARK